MAYVDTIDKIVGSYFAPVTREKFAFLKRGGKTIIYHPRPLQVRQGFGRGYVCPTGCGGCCYKFSLDYLPEPKEKHPYQLTPRTRTLNGKAVTIYSDTQQSHQGTAAAISTIVTGAARFTPLSFLMAATRFPVISN